MDEQLRTQIVGAFTRWLDASAPELTDWLSEIEVDDDAGDDMWEALNESLDDANAELSRWRAWAASIIGCAEALIETPEDAERNYELARQRSDIPF